MLVTVQGNTGRFEEGTGVGTEKTLRLTTIQSLSVAQVEGPNTEAARSGSRFAGGCQVIASGIAPVAAIPTTTATLALVNTDSLSSVIVDQVGFFLGSGTPTAGATLLLGLTNGTIAAPTAAANYSSQSMGKAGSTSFARWATAVTFPAGSAWFQAVSSFQLAAANVGQGGDVYISGGGIVIPPGYALGIAILSGAGTTPLYSVSAVWNELRVDLEP